MTQPLPIRLVVASQGAQALVVRDSMLAADYTLREDADLLIALGFGDFISVQPARRRIQFTTGGAVAYLGGSGEYLEERVRGMSAAHLDDGGLLDPRIAAVITRS